MNFLQAKPGDSIVVVGTGAVGLSAIMAAKLAGCSTIVAVDIKDNRLELAKELGATHTINSKDKDYAEVIRNEIAPEGLMYGLDTTGRVGLMNQTIKALRFKGHLAIVMIAGEKLELDATPFLTGLSVSYVLEGDSRPQEYIPRLIELYKSGLFPFDKLVKFYDFEDFEKAVEDSENGSTIKAIIRMPN